MRVSIRTVCLLTVNDEDGLRGERFMLRRRNGIRQIPKNKNRGAALMVAVVIIGILMVFTLSLLLVTYSLYASQNKNAAGTRNSEAANTLSVALTSELEKKQSEGELWRYLRFNICNSATWTFYEPGLAGHGETEAFRYFNLNYNFVAKYFENPSTTDQDPLSGLEGFPGTVKLCIYWRLPETPKNTEGPEENPEDVAEALYQGGNKTGIRLYIEVICETGSQSYVVKNKYILNEAPFGSGEFKLKSALKNYSKEPAYNPLLLDDRDGIDLNQNWTWRFDSRE